MPNVFAPGYPPDTPQITHGQLQQVRFITKSHGIVRPNLGDTLDINPTHSNKKVEEFDNLAPAVIWTQFEEVTGKYSYKDSNSPITDAVLADADPTNKRHISDPRRMAYFHVLVNDPGLDGNIFQATFVPGCVPMGPTSSSTLKEAKANSLDFHASYLRKVKGYGIHYSRVLADSAAQVAAPSAPTLADQSTGGNLSDGAYYVSLTAITADGETDASVNAGVVLDGGGSSQSIDVTIPSVSAPITGYNVYVGTRSDDLRKSNSSPLSSTPYTITDLPIPSDALFPVDNTTGPFVQVLATTSTPGNAALDLRWASSGPWVTTLEKAAIAVHNPRHEDERILFALKNGAPAKEGFVISNDGLTIELAAQPGVNDVWEFLTAYDPAA